MKRHKQHKKRSDFIRRAATPVGAPGLQAAATANTRPARPFPFFEGERGAPGAFQSGGRRGALFAPRAAQSWGRHTLFSFATPFCQRQHSHLDEAGTQSNTPTTIKQQSKRNTVNTPSTHLSKHASIYQNSNGKWEVVPGEALLPGDVVSIGRPAGGASDDAVVPAGESAPSLCWGQGAGKEEWNWVQRDGAEWGRGGEGGREPRAAGQQPPARRELETLRQTQHTDTKRETPKHNRLPAARRHVHRRGGRADRRVDAAVEGAGQRPGRRPQRAPAH